MKPGQAEDRYRQQGDDRHQDHRHDRFHLRQFVLLLLEDVDQREREDAQHVDRQRDQEEEEEPVVPPADAVVHPRAVVIECLDAMVAYGAVRTPWRSVELTRHAPFHPHRDAIDFGIFVQRSPELVLTIFVRWGFRYDTGIHEGGHRKVGDDEERDDGLVRWHPWVSLHVELATWVVEKQERRPQQQCPGEGRWDVSGFDITFRHRVPSLPRRGTAGAASYRLTPNSLLDVVCWPIFFPNHLTTEQNPIWMGNETTQSSLSSDTSPLLTGLRSVAFGSFFPRFFVWLFLH